MVTMLVRFPRPALLILAGLVVSLAHRPRYRTEGDIRETRRRLAGLRDPRRGDWGGGEEAGGRKGERGEGLKPVKDIVQSILSYDDLVDTNSYDHHKEEDSSQRTIEYFETNTSKTFQAVEKDEEGPGKTNHTINKHKCVQKVAKVDVYCRGFCGLGIS